MEYKDLFPDWEEDNLQANHSIPQSQDYYKMRNYKVYFYFLDVMLIRYFQFSYN